MKVSWYSSSKRFTACFVSLSVYNLRNLSGYAIRLSPKTRTSIDEEFNTITIQYIYCDYKIQPACDLVVLNSNKNMNCKINSCQAKELCQLRKEKTGSRLKMRHFFAAYLCSRFSRTLPLFEK